jgi:tetratricopeptide (TPR) repeat protein
MSRLLLAGPDPDLEEAANHLKWAVDLYPGQVDLYPRLITLLQEQGDLDTAARYLRRLSAYADRDPQLRAAELRLLQEQGDFDTAVWRLGQFVGQTSSESDQLALAWLHRRVGEYEEAERIYDRVLAAPDRSNKAVTDAADFYASLGDFDEATALLRSLDDAVAEALALGDLYQKHGDSEEAEQWYTEAWRRLAAHYLVVADHEQARQAALAGLRIDPQHTTLQAALAAASFNLGEAARREALDIFEEVGGDNPAVRDTVALCDRVATAEGRMVPTEQDLADANELVRLHPRFLPAWQIAITMHADGGRREEAVQLARRAVGRLPAEAQPAEWATHLLVKAGRLEEALDMARSWRRRSQQRPIEADTFIASLQVDLGRPRVAVLQLEPHADRIWAERDRFPQRMIVWLREGSERLLWISPMRRSCSSSLSCSRVRGPRSPWPVNGQISPGDPATMGTLTGLRVSRWRRVEMKGGRFHHGSFGASSPSFAATSKRRNRCTAICWRASLTTSWR